MPRWYIAGFERSRGQVFVPAVGGGATSWNDSDKGSNISLSNSFRTVTKTTTDQYGCVRSVATIGATAKVYYEVVIDATIDRTGIGMGFAKASFGLTGSPLGMETPTQSFMATGEGNRYRDFDSPNDLGAVGGGNFITGTRIGIAWDVAAAKSWWRKDNGPWNNDAGADPAATTGGYSVVATGGSGDWYAAVMVYTATGTADVLTANFASADWVDAAPSGFVAIS